MSKPTNNPELEPTRVYIEKGRHCEFQGWAIGSHDLEIGKRVIIDALGRRFNATVTDLTPMGLVTAWHAEACDD